MKVSNIITLTTDFGLSDPYVGIMKGVIMSINREARVIDISHKVKAGSLIQAAGLVREAYSFFPEGTIHVAVVDPGVGGDRRPILLRTQDHLFVGPDNGLFWPVITAHQHTEIIHLTKREYFLPNVSNTFHGRDIFAPVAAHVSRGVDPLEMGATINDPVVLRLAGPQQEKDRLTGRVIRVDNFGNLITNIQRGYLKGFLGKSRPVIRIGNLIVEGLQKTYSEAKRDEPLALIGSSDHLEIAVNLGRASGRLEVNSEDVIGMELEVRRAGTCYRGSNPL
ncbi:MAG: SAM-dependent chlorinase/fluorinase [Thermodesulfobacteriota bacterium]|nr:SAM-dependent chlorinase/fluorinase [Thermodesulfobacteriota bacterium]